MPRLLDSIRNSDVRALPPGLGSVEQRSDNVDLLTSARHRRAQPSPDPAAVLEQFRQRMNTQWAVVETFSL